MIMNVWNIISEDINQRYKTDQFRTVWKPRSETQLRSQTVCPTHDLLLQYVKSYNYISSSYWVPEDQCRIPTLLLRSFSFSFFFLSPFSQNLVNWVFQKVFQSSRVQFLILQVVYEKYKYLFTAYPSFVFGFLESDNI